MKSLSQEIRELKAYVLEEKEYGILEQTHLDSPERYPWIVDGEELGWVWKTAHELLCDLRMSVSVFLLLAFVFLCEKWQVRIASFVSLRSGCEPQR